MEEDGLLVNLWVNPIDTKNGDALEFIILMREEATRR